MMTRGLDTLDLGMLLGEELGGTLDRPLDAVDVLLLLREGDGPGAPGVRPEEDGPGAPLSGVLEALLLPEEKMRAP